MKYFNAVDFFDKVIKLANDMIESVLFDDEPNEKMVEEGFISAIIMRQEMEFTKANGETAPLFCSFFCTETEDSETDEEDHEILTVFNFCKFSLDNKKYCFLYDACKNQAMVDIINNPLEHGDYKLYVCDITETIYTVISPENACYYVLKWNTGEITKKVNSSDTEHYIYYDNTFVAFYDINKYYNIDFDPDGVGPLSVAKYFLKNKDNVYLDIKPLTIDDFEDAKEYFFKPDTPKKVVSTIKKRQEEYKEEFGSNPIRITLFGKSKTIRYAPENLTLAILTCGLDDLFRGKNKDVKYPQMLLKEEFQTLVTNSVSATGMFDVETFVYNAAEGSFLPYEIYMAFWDYFTDLFRHFPQTYIMYGSCMFLRGDSYMEGHVIDPLTLQKNNDAIFDEIPSLQYVKGFISILEDVAEQVNQYSQDVEDFNKDFEVYGGGFGIGGMIKGMLTAAVVSATAQTLYSVYKASKIDKKGLEAMAKEFMVSNESKEFFKEMFKIDAIYLVLKSYKVIADVIKEHYASFEKHIDYEKLFVNFDTAYKIYSIALAKHLKLEVLPVYEFYEEEYNKTPVELMKKVLWLFPFNYEFYEKYLEFGGTMSEQLNNYAKAHLVDISDLYNQEKERLEKEKREAEEKKKKAQERKKAAEEKRKKEEERIKVELASLSEFYGELPTRYPDVFRLLLDNPIYSQNRDAKIENHNQVADNVFNYLSSIYSSDQHTNLFSGTSGKFFSKKENLKAVHGYNKITDYNVLMFFDVTVFGSARDGFTLTNDNICVHNSFEQPYSVAIKDVKDLSISGTQLFINKKQKIDIGVSCVKPEEFLNIFSYCVCSLLHLAEKGYKAKPPEVVSAPAPQPSAPAGGQTATGTIKSLFGKLSSTIESMGTTKSTWKCTCGKDVNIDDNFCPNCGTKKPFIPAEWVCPNCKNNNSKDANFCSKCGIKRQ